MTDDHDFFSPDPDYWDRAFTITLTVVLVFLLTILMTSCSPQIIEKVTVEYRDTTIIREVVRDSLIQVPIPLEKNQAIVSTDDTSRLETSIASSVAYVTHAGQLHHELSNKQGATLPAIVPIYHHITHTVQSTETAQIIEKRVEVPKPLTRWQSFRLRAFPWLLGLLAAAGLWTFRKPILKIIKP